MPQESDRSQPVPGNPVIPVEIFVGEICKIKGLAAITGDSIQVKVENEIGGQLIRAVEEGVLSNLSVSLNPVPATPMLDDNGHVKWVRSY